MMALLDSIEPGVTTSLGELTVAGGTGALQVTLDDVKSGRTAASVAARRLLDLMN